MEELSEITILGLTLSDFLGRVVYLAIVVVIALVVQRFLVRALHKVLDNSEIPSASIFINIVRALLWLLALLSVLKPVFGVDPTGFMAALGVSSIVISFGLQATISNIVAGLGLMIGKVVQPGDQVSVGTFSGEVVDVTWRHTVVRGRDGSEQVIPNSVLNTTALTRRTDLYAQDCAVPLAIKKGSDLVRVERDVLGLGGDLIKEDLDPQKPASVLFDAVGDFNITATAHFYLKPGASPWTARDKVIRAVANCDWIA